MIQRLVRVCAAILLVGAGVRLLIVDPYRGNLAAKEFRLLTDRALRESSRPTRTRTAAQSVTSLRRELRHNPHDARLHLLTAANLRILRREQQAIVHYERALKTERRPEIFYNLGLAEVASGRREEGIGHLVAASMFNPWILSVDLQHSRPDLFREVASIVEAKVAAAEARASRNS